jgi:hypothetical protein
VEAKRVDYINVKMEKNSLEAKKDSGRRSTRKFE